ncbi:AAA family ATPase [Bremerella sp. JC817]|uniref:AAA family ATPase n=1 Tax=Bremerella sp. JC817 TaxID=3231756 RepID=UPI003457642B
MLPGNWCYVITGASGAGKSIRIAARRELGYATVPEAANTILREQRKIGGRLLPTTDRQAFIQAVFERSVADFERAATYAGPLFFNRAIPEWLRFLGWKEAACQQARGEISRRGEGDRRSAVGRDLSARRRTRSAL